MPLARKKKAKRVTQETIWEIPEAAWKRMETILNKRYPKSPAGGRPPADWRKALNGIIFRMRTGCQWNRLPRDFGDDSTVHRWFQRWVEDGVFEKLWSVLLAECEELGGVDWEWQAADGCLGKARFGGAKQARTPRTGEDREPRKASSSKQVEALSV